MDQATAHLSCTAWCHLMHIRSENKPVLWLLLLPPASPPPKHRPAATRTPPTHISLLPASQTEWHSRLQAPFQCWGLIIWHLLRHVDKWAAQVTNEAAPTVPPDGTHRLGCSKAKDTVVCLFTPFVAAVPGLAIFWKHLPAAKNTLRTQLVRHHGTLPCDRAGLAHKPTLPSGGMRSVCWSPTGCLMV